MILISIRWKYKWIGTIYSSMSEKKKKHIQFCWIFGWNLAGNVCSREAFQTFARMSPHQRLWWTNWFWKWCWSLSLKWKCASDKSIGSIYGLKLAKIMPRILATAKQFISQYRYSNPSVNYMVCCVPTELCDALDWAQLDWKNMFIDHKSKFL